MMGKYSLAVALMAIALSGCAAFDNRTRPEVFALPAADSGMATIVVSTGALERCIPFVTHLRFYEASSQYGAYNFKAELPVDNYTIKSDFTSHHGYLHVINLPAGSYYAAPGVLHPYVVVKNIPKADFTLKAGDVAYFGEYFLSVSCSMSNHSTWIDRSERDLVLLKERNPSVAKAINRKFIPTFTGRIGSVEK